jgi:hypothetical protein
MTKPVGPTDTGQSYRPDGTDYQSAILKTSVMTRSRGINL